MINELLRRFKGSYALYNLLKTNELQHIKQQYDKLGLKKKYFEPVSSADFQHLESEVPWLDAGDSTILSPKNKDFQSLPKNVQDAILNWSEKGYAIIENFISEAEVEKINTEIDDLVSQKKVNWGYQNKIMFAFEQLESIRKVGENEILKTALNTLLGREVALFQSINFLKGSEQATHSDTVHMTTFPLGFMIAVWVALEDIRLENGPLHYYEGSHRLPYILNKDYEHGGSQWWIGKDAYPKYEQHIAKIVEKNELEKKVFLAKKGDILIWHANLLHGGEPQLDKEMSRKSMVFHYYTKDVACFHEISQRPAFIK